MDNLEILVWEFTAGCNYRCAHCASACGDRQEGELSTDEALDAARQIAALKPGRVTISGGEPLLREDFLTVVRTFHSLGQNVNFISNGALMTEQIARGVQEYCSLAAISIEGPRELHDRIRGAGAWQKAEQAFSLLRGGIPLGSNTTVMKSNIDLLPQIRDELTRFGAAVWQIQPAILFGNMRADQALAPEDMERIIEFAYEQNLKDGIRIFLPDNVGYYTEKECIARQCLSGPGEPPMWHGCNAGSRIIGLLHNGDVIGCTAIRDRRFTEGNIRDRPLADILNSPDSFAWRKNLRAEDFSGHCAACPYITHCLGGCSAMRLAYHDDIHASNEYCVYAVKRLAARGGVGNQE
jgi:radical SAM protein with 4Fe4S-binding SPASM domain